MQLRQPSALQRWHRHRRICSYKLVMSWCHRSGLFLLGLCLWLSLINGTVPSGRREDGLSFSILGCFLHNSIRSAIGFIPVFRLIPFRNAPGWLDMHRTWTCDTNYNPYQMKIEQYKCEQWWSQCMYIVRTWRGRCCHQTSLKVQKFKVKTCRDSRQRHGNTCTTVTVRHRENSSHFLPL